jgi:hypothetical protein
MICPHPSGRFAETPRRVSHDAVSRAVLAQLFGSLPEGPGLCVGILPILLAMGGLIGGIHIRVDRDHRRYLLRLREESRLRQQQLDDEISTRDRATRRVREAS